MGAAGATCGAAGSGAGVACGAAGAAGAGAAAAGAGVDAGAGTGGAACGETGADAGWLGEAVAVACDVELDGVPPPVLYSGTAAFALLFFRIVARAAARFFVLGCNRSNGTCTTAKPGRGAPLKQPAPPPGFELEVPKYLPMIDMYTCPAFA